MIFHRLNPSFLPHQLILILLFSVLFVLAWILLIPSAWIIEHHKKPLVVFSTLHTTLSYLIILPDKKIRFALFTTFYESTGENGSRFWIRMTPKTVKNSTIINLVKYLTLNHHLVNPLLVKYLIFNYEYTEKADCNFESRGLRKLWKTPWPLIW